MKLALETRKSNVEAINALLLEIKEEGELTANGGHFPADVGEKISRLNADWQVIIELAINLKTPQVEVKEVEEEYIVNETLQMEYSQEYNFLGE